MRMTSFRWTVLCALATSAFAGACDFGYEDPPMFGSPFPGSGGTVLDAGSTVQPRSACSGLDDGDPCRSSSTSHCEVRAYANAACNRFLSCQDTTWRSLPAERDGCATECPTELVADRPDACTSPNAASLVCEYREGTCGCAPVRRGIDGGDGGDDPDAGEPDDAGPTVYEWRCVAPEPGCPRTRPATGTECVRPMSCDYGDCIFEDGVTMTCAGGRWMIDRRCLR